MFYVPVVILIYLVHGSLCQDTGNNCIPKVSTECQSNGEEAVCTGANITSLPDFIDCGFHISQLTFTSTSIANLSGNSLPPGLNTLAFYDTPLQYISDDAFDSCATTLNLIAFGNSMPNHIPNAFLNLTSLQTLEINDVNIQDWNVPVLQKIGSAVTDFGSTNTGLKAWPVWLKYFSSLTALQLSTTQIWSIPEDALVHIAHSLSTFELSYSNLTQIPQAILALNRLDFLYLKWNQIIDITNVNPTVKSVDLTGNRITNIYTETFSNAVNLRDLVLSNNPITRIAVDAFLKTPLISLQLEGTNLTRVPLALLKLTHLMTLDLGENERMVCTCVESSLQTWFFSLPDMEVDGECDAVDIREFFTRIAVDCPK
ncbi:unnamed protein product [Lymnaea stagnalis]|uniref:Uncharacterized protein n=1 Tax=Lymnaea stagnalis TaxID=6523 RepID=A0AAV2IKX5_LYMST